MQKPTACRWNLMRVHLVQQIELLMLFRVWKNRAYRRSKSPYDKPLDHGIKLEEIDTNILLSCIIFSTFFAAAWTVDGSKSISPMTFNCTSYSSSNCLLLYSFRPSIRRWEQIHTLADKIPAAFLLLTAWLCLLPQEAAWNFPLKMHKLWCIPHPASNIFQASYNAFLSTLERHWRTTVKTHPP